MLSLHNGVTLCEFNMDTTKADRKRILRYPKFFNKIDIKLFQKFRKNSRETLRNGQRKNAVPP